MAQLVYIAFLLIVSSVSGTKLVRSKNILLYTELNTTKSWYLRDVVTSDKYFERNKCLATNCVITYNKTYLPNLSDYDVILMSAWNVPSLDAFPPPESRHPDQVYVLHFRESPLRTPSIPADFSLLFNWTMSYRLDADVDLSYGKFHDKETHGLVAPSLKPAWRQPTNATIPDDSKIRSIVKSKTKFAAWFVSNCDTAPSERIYVVKNMQEFGEIDVYGKCGNLDCNITDKRICRQMVERDYKFYLAFENSLCTDYVTEKAFSMMEYYVIPVVYGGADYTRFLPPHSYINVLDYDSVEELVTYLHFLANNEKEYLKYFWWKEFYYILNHNYCGICEKITRFGEKPNYITYHKDINNWFKNGTCMEPRDIPLIKSILDQYQNTTITHL